MNRILCAFFLTLSASSNFANNLSPITILCVGDSTVSSYPETSTYRGWGQMLPKYFRPEVTISNAARGGTSSRSFYELGLWKEAIAMKPDYVLIQFGHNDRAKDDRGTDPATTYKDCIRRYIEEAQAVGARPIMIGSMSPRNFSLKNGILRSSVKPYAEAMKKVAEEEKVPFIDLHELSFHLFEKLGAEQSKQFAPKKNDINHFNAAGADLLARIVADGISADVPELKPYLLKPDEKLATEVH